MEVRRSKKLRAIFFVFLEAPFAGAIQVILYAGAIMVLFLFVVMLLDPAGEGFAGRVGHTQLVATILGAAALFARGRVDLGEHLPLAQYLIAVCFDVLERALHILPTHDSPGLRSQILRACARAREKRRADERDSNSQHAGSPVNSLASLASRESSESLPRQTSLESDNAK